LLLLNERSLAIPELAGYLDEFRTLLIGKLQDFSHGLSQPFFRPVATPLRGRHALLSPSLRARKHRRQRENAHSHCNKYSFH
jgi:hypothetical protein